LDARSPSARLNAGWGGAIAPILLVDATPPPTPHRVVNTNNALRHVIPFFYGPCNDAVIRVVETCTGPDDPA